MLHSTVANAALSEVAKLQGHARAKGFKRASAPLVFTRSDCDIYRDPKSGKWVADVYTMYNGCRDKLLTRKAADMLTGLLRAVL